METRYGSLIESEQEFTEMNGIQVLLTNLRLYGRPHWRCIVVREGNTVKVPKHDSTGTIQADGNIIWGRDGNKAIYEETLVVLR